MSERIYLRGLTTMAETARDPQAVREYERTRDEVAEHTAVDEAENVIASAWITELEDTRRTALGLVAAMRVSARAAGEDLRAAQRDGGPGEVARAHARLASLQAEQEVAFERARSLLAFVDTELNAAGLAGIERARRAHHDLERLRAAWANAYAEG